MQSSVAQRACFFLKSPRTGVRRAAQPQLLYRQHHCHKGDFATPCSRCDAHCAYSGTQIICASRLKAHTTRVLCRGRTCEFRQLLGRRQWYIMSQGEEQALRCSVVCVGEGRSEGLSAGPPGQVLKELRDARLLLVRIPPSCFPDVLHYGRHWGLSRWRLVQFPPLRDRAASDQGPGHSTVLTGSSLHGGPQ